MDDVLGYMVGVIAIIVFGFGLPWLIFSFITIDAEQSINDQHHQLRRLFREGEQRPWSDWNAPALAEWLALTRGNGE